MAKKTAWIMCGDNVQSFSSRSCDVLAKCPICIEHEAVEKELAKMVLAYKLSHPKRYWISPAQDADAIIAEARQSAGRE